MPLKTQQKNQIQIPQQYSERILNKSQNLNQIFFQVDSSKFGGRVGRESDFSLLGLHI